MNQSEDKRRLRRIEKIKAKLREKINVTKDLKYVQTYKYMTNLHRAVGFGIISEEERQIRLKEISHKWAAIECKLHNDDYLRSVNLFVMFYYKEFKEFHNVWIALCMSGLEQIETLEDTGKYPSSRKIYNQLWEWYEGDRTFEEVHEFVFGDITCSCRFLDGSSRELNEEYDKKLPRLEKTDTDGIKVFIQGYFKWVSKELSKKGCITFEETHSKIYELLEIEEE